MNPIEAIEDPVVRTDAERRFEQFIHDDLMRGLPAMRDLSRWPMWLRRHDNLPSGCLAAHLDKILK